MRLPEYVDTNEGFRHFYDPEQVRTDFKTARQYIPFIPLLWNSEDTTYIPLGDHETPRNTHLGLLVSESLNQTGLTVIEFLPTPAEAPLPTNIALRQDFPLIYGFVFEYYKSPVEFHFGGPVSILREGGQTNPLGRRFRASIHRRLAEAYDMAKRKNKLRLSQKVSANY